MIKTTNVHNKKQFQRNHSLLRLVIIFCCFMLIHINYLYRKKGSVGRKFAQIVTSLCPFTRRGARIASICLL